MRKFAAHRLYLSATEMVAGPVVVQLADDGRVASFEVLTAEQPAVEWLGGIFLLLPASEVPKQLAGSFGTWYASLGSYDRSGNTFYNLWHVSGIPADTGLMEISVTAPRRLG